MKKIDFRQPKYLVPALLYFPIIYMGFMIMSIDEGSKGKLENRASIEKMEYLSVDKVTTRTQPLQDMKTWANNALHFFGDIFTKGAIRVYMTDRAKENKKDTITITEQ